MNEENKCPRCNGHIFFVKNKEIVICENVIINNNNEIKDNSYCDYRFNLRKGQVE